MNEYNPTATTSVQRYPGQAGRRQPPRPLPRAAATRAAIVAIALSALCLISGSVSANATAATTHAAKTAKGSPLPGAGDPPIYWDTIKQQLANGLHTTVPKLKRLWGNTTITGPKGQSVPTMTTILDVAIEHGISQSRLRSIELAAIQTACDVLVHKHKLTTKQASARMKLIRAWSQPNLDGYSMYAYEQH